MIARFMSFYKPGVTKGPFDVVPQLAYSKTIAKSDKKPSRHFIRSEAFVNEKVIYRK